MFRVLQELSLGGSAGNLPKWYCEDNYGKFLYVKGRSSFDTFEPEMEVFCYELALCMGLPVIHQFLVNIPELSHLPLSASYDFSEGKDCMTLFRYLRKVIPQFGLTLRDSRYNAVISLLSNEDRVLHDSILAFDYIVGNHDRHLRNFECYESERGIKLIPAFDFGMALFSNRQVVDVSALGANPYARRHREQLDLLIGINFRPRLTKVSNDIIDALILKHLKYYPHANMIRGFIKQNQQTIQEYCDNNKNSLTKSMIFSNSTF